MIKRFHNIEARDALLAWDREQPVRGEDGNIRTQWDQRTMRRNPVTGDEIPDETARRIVYEYINPRRASWPAADFIIGNPPFIAGKDMRGEFGDGYTEALRSTYEEIPDSAEYVTYWWHRAAKAVRAGSARRFAFITTNSLRQTFSRRVVAQHLQADPPLSLAYAIPDHPWVDSRDGADVRISMTVGERGRHEGLLARVVREIPGPFGAEVDLSERRGFINPDLTVGPNVAAALPLKANWHLSSRGVELHGSAFLVTHSQARQLGLGRIDAVEKHLKRYRHGRDITQGSRDLWIIDVDGESIEAVRERFPEIFQHLNDRVRPERDQNNDPSRRRNWWMFGRRNTELRRFLRDLTRYIATPETAKHRFFVFLEADILPDNMLVNFGLEDAHFLAVLSSRVHVAWTLAAGGTLEDRPRYNKTRCFDPFPFPDASQAQRQHLRALGESLDAHRKRQQSLHPRLKLTDMYNVLEKIRSGRDLDEAEQTIHEQALASVLLDIHDELDAAVLNAYGWPVDISTENLLYRLVALNEERQLEERRGIVRWLRPDFQQQPEARQAGLDIDIEEAAPPTAARRPWPQSLPERVRAVRTILAEQLQPLDADSLARIFTRARRQDVQDIAETLVSLNQARRVESRYTI